MEQAPLGSDYQNGNMVPFGNNSQFFDPQPAVAARPALPIAFTLAKPLRIGSGTGRLPPRLRRAESGWRRPARVFRGANGVAN
jgi:hypothetical protein